MERLPKGDGDTQFASPSEEENDFFAETRSAPGDLAVPASSKGLDGCDNVVPSSSGLPSLDGVLSLPQNTNTRPAGHYRNINNGFASGPPWPTPKREKSWATVRVWQKQQQIQAIEKEITVMANETLVGIRKWRPPWLQRFSSLKWMLFWLCWYCAVQGLLVNGLVPSAITSIERRFQFTSSTIGRIMQFYDFGYVLFCIPVSYFGGRHSKPVVLAMGLILLASGSFIFTLPHSISESYTLSDNADDPHSMCDASQLGSGFQNHSSGYLSVSKANAEALKACPSPENQPGSFRYVFLFCFAHFLNGIAATPLFTLGVSFIDENVGPTLSSLYLGIFYSFAIFGPTLGFLMQSYFLRFHTDFLQEELKSVRLQDEMDPKWVGAWWVGFLIASALALLAVFPVLSLPKVLPESLQWHRTRLHEESMLGNKRRTPECCGIPSTSKTAAVCGPLLTINPEDKASVPTITIGESMPALQKNRGPVWYHIWLDLRHIPISIYRILCSSSYMLITLAMAVDGLIITGASTFMSKYLERQFSVPPSKANMVIGCIMVPMAGIGTVFSGFIVQRFRLSCVKTLKFCIALLLFSLLLSPMYLVYCDHDQLAGIETHYPMEGTRYGNSMNETGSGLALKSGCNEHCDCVDSEYHPVCAELQSGKQIAFFSPCYAGCEKKYDPVSKVYDNCSCVPENTKRVPKQVKRGYCESKCTGLVGFLVMFAPFCFFAFAVGVPLISVILRTVDYAERSFALGIQWILVRVIGTIPAPVLFGWMFDVSCIRRHMDQCSKQEGSCTLYDNKKLAELFMAFGIMGQMLAMILLIFTLVFFSSQLRDDPLPTAAVAVQDISKEADVSLDGMAADDYTNGSTSDKIEI